MNDSYKHITFGNQEDYQKAEEIFEQLKQEEVVARDNFGPNFFDVSARVFKLFQPLLEAAKISFEVEGREYKSRFASDAFSRQLEQR